MPKKPTEPFGHIAFGKNGSVRKRVDVLPDIKDEQERSVALRFGAMLATATGRHFEVYPFEENDHDFWLKSHDQKIVVQATEVVSRDYLRPLDIQDYVNGRHSYSEFVCEGTGKMYGVDHLAKENVLLTRIKGKLAKRYAKPKDPFWLLIWTVRADLVPFYSAGGQHIISSSVVTTRDYLARSGASPFDEIWFFYLETRPHRIWPL